MQKQYLTTNDFAEVFGVKGNTVRRGLCVHGHYMGIVPLKMPNNRLLWPVASAKQLLKQNDEARGQ